MPRAASVNWQVRAEEERRLVVWLLRVMVVLGMLAGRIEPLGLVVVRQGQAECRPTALRAALDRPVGSEASRRPRRFPERPKSRTRNREGQAGHLWLPEPAVETHSTGRFLFLVFTDRESRLPHEELLAAVIQDGLDGVRAGGQLPVPPAPKLSLCPG